MEGRDGAKTIPGRSQWTRLGAQLLAKHPREVEKIEGEKVWGQCLVDHET